MSLFDRTPKVRQPKMFDTRCEQADHARARADAEYLLNAEDWPSRRTPINASMLGNLARAYIERDDARGRA